jgi:hypothetical protein
VNGFLLTPAGLLLLLVILVLAVASARRGAIVAPGVWDAAWAGVTIGFVLIGGGLGHTWGFWSVVGKLAVLGIALALPLGVAAVVGRWLARRRASGPQLAGAMFVSGGLVAHTTPWTALYLLALILHEGL